MTETLNDAVATVIAVEHLHKAYGATVAVDDVSFSVTSRRDLRRSRAQRRGQDDDGRVSLRSAGSRRWASRRPRP